MAGQFLTPKIPPMAAGQRYGRLVAVEVVKRESQSGTRWRFQCDCGREHVALAANARKGIAQSCGCLRSELASRRGRGYTTHGMHGTVENKAWSVMLERCRNPRRKNFDCYGGRGIKVCERWLKFENFYADMGPRPSPLHSLDRKDNDGDYEPSNCRWGTVTEQQRNRRNNIIVAYGGQKMTLIEVCERLGLNYETIRQRIKIYGWTVERALSTPARRPASG